VEEYVHGWGFKMHDFGGVLNSTVGRVQRQGYIKGTVEKIVAEGFPSEEEVVDLVVKALEGDPADKELMEDICRLTKQAIRQHIYIQTSWVSKTDCDKLDEVFAALEHAGIMARQNLAVNEKSGRDEIRKLVKLEEPDRLGFVFYTARDTENAVEFGELDFSFGSFDGDEEKSAQIARKLIELLEKSGLHAEWTGAPTDRVHMAEIQWKKRRLDAGY
jgi:hypothetical protein